MTNTVPTNAEELITAYETGAKNWENNDILPLLQTRTQIQQQIDQLTAEQMARVEDVDRWLIKNSDEIVSQYEASGRGTFADQRALANQPPHEWWWYLDVMDNAGDYYTVNKVPTQRERTISMVLNVLQLAALAVALFLLARNLNIIPMPPTPTPARHSQRRFRCQPKH
jgi:hypothetical protein